MPSVDIVPEGPLWDSKDRDTTGAIGKETEGGAKQDGPHLPPLTHSGLSNALPTISGRPSGSHGLEDLSHGLVDAVGPPPSTLSPSAPPAQAKMDSDESHVSALS